MSETKKWELKDKAIIKSLTAVFEKQDINELSLDAYRFVINISGFIAHYNIDGFKSNYQDLRSFADCLLTSSDVLRPDYYIDDKYFSEGAQAEYYAKKSAILRAIPAIVNKSLADIEKNFTNMEREADLAEAKRLTAKWAE